MIKKYGEFLIESLLMKLDESVIYYSDEFYEMLKRIDSNVSNKLISLNSEYRDTDVNFIDVTDNPDQLSFIPDSKGESLFPKPPNNKDNWYRVVVNNTNFCYTFAMHIFIDLGLPQVEHPAPYIGTKGWAKKVRYSTNDLQYFIADLDDPLFIKAKQEIQLRQESVFAIVGEGLEVVDYKKEVTKSTKGRNPIKTGRLIKKLLQINNFKVSDKEIQDFVNQYKSIFSIIKDEFRNFKIVQGEEIRHHYLETNYDKDFGTLGKSCMKYKKCQEFFDIYTNNSQVKMLVLINPLNNKTTGRALLWSAYLKNTSEKITFMDRVYTNNDSDLLQFLEYAKSNDWYFKEDQTCGEYFGLSSNNDSVITRAELIVELDESDFDYYPYIDSLKYLCVSSKKLSNSKSAMIPYNSICHLESQTGGDGSGCEYCDGGGTNLCNVCSGHGMVPCVCNNNTDICTKCRGNNAIECTECSGDGTFECEECS